MKALLIALITLSVLQVPAIAGTQCDTKTNPDCRRGRKEITFNPPASNPTPKKTVSGSGR